MQTPWQKSEVPVAAVQDLVGKGIQTVPEAYIQHVSQRPACSTCSLATGAIPVVDLTRLSDAGDTLGRKQTKKAIARGCEEWGFFQVLNHGVSEKLLEDVLDLANGLFSLPEEEKKKYADPELHPSSGKFATSLLPSRDLVLDWRDVIEHRFTEGDKKDQRMWPEKPVGYRQVMWEFREAIKGLAERLLMTVSENLGLRRDYINRIVGSSTDLVNLVHYPLCPEPELVLGVSCHSDPSVITLLVQDDVGGLEVRAKDGHWVSVEPIPHAIVVNVGDILQVISNGRYPSVEHQVVVNAHKAGRSVVTYHCPHNDSKIAPAPGLTAEDQPPRYTEFCFPEYVSALHLARRRPLESFYLSNR